MREHPGKMVCIRNQFLHSGRRIAVLRRRLRLVVLTLLPMSLASCGDDFSEVAVISAVADDAGGVSLSVSACNSRPAAEATVVSQDATTVTVEARANDSSSDDCADGAVVCLDEPLGQREIVDASTGQTVSVEPYLAEDLCP